MLSSLMKSTPRAFGFAVSGVAFAIAALGCNAITGADNFVLSGDGAGGSNHGSGGSSPSGGSESTGNGNGNADTGAGAGGPMNPVGDATGITVDRVAFYQGVESNVVVAGQAQNPSASLVAGRPAVVRVFIKVGQTSGAPIRGRLTLGSAAPIEVAVPSPHNSSQADFASTVNFQVPAADMVQGMGYRVEMIEDETTSQGLNPASHVPATGLQSVTVKPSGRVKIKLIPVQYGADGSNRLPDTSAAQVQAYKDLFFAMYPATEIDISVGAAFPWSQSIDAGGNGWDNLLSSLSDFRNGAQADFDEFYYGIFDPASSFESFCGGGCVAGLGFIGDPNGLYSRAAIGLGYGGDVSTQTAVHEVGHNHGRPHSPCGGASDPDPGFPYSGASIGSWGLVLGTNQLLSPSDYTDVMGYCHPQWISDYVFDQILAFKNQMQNDIVFPPESMDQTYERVRVGPSGTTFLAPMVMHQPPLGPSQTVTVNTASGSQQLTGRFYAFDHLDGGVLFVKQPTQLVQSLDFEVTSQFGAHSYHVTR